MMLSFWPTRQVFRIHEREHVVYLLLKFCLVCTLQLGFDVFNALDLMQNASILEELKFGIGDGNLQYYVYNWRCPDMKPEQIGLVLQ